MAFSFTPAPDVTACQRAARQGYAMDLCPGINAFPDNVEYGGPGHCEI